MKTFKEIVENELGMEWFCPKCKEMNTTYAPEKIVQCTWCSEITSLIGLEVFQEGEDGSKILTLKDIKFLK